MTMTLWPAKLSLGPDIDVILLPKKEGDQVGITLFAHTPSGDFSAQAMAKPEAWRAMLRAGKARVGPLLERWHQMIYQRWGLTQSPYAREVTGAAPVGNDLLHPSQGAAVGCSSCGYWNNAWRDGWNGNWQPFYNPAFWVNYSDWDTWGPYPYGVGGRYFPISPLYPINTLPPTSGFLYPRGLAQLPANPDLANSRRYSWAYPPFTSDWVESRPFCSPLGCGI